MPSQKHARARFVTRGRRPPSVPEGRAAWRAVAAAHCPSRREVATFVHPPIHLDQPPHTPLHLANSAHPESPGAGGSANYRHDHFAHARRPLTDNDTHHPPFHTFVDLPPPHLRHAHPPQPTLSHLAPPRVCGRLWAAGGGCAGADAPPHGLCRTPANRRHWFSTKISPTTHRTALGSGARQPRRSGACGARRHDRLCGAAATPRRSRPRRARGRPAAWAPRCRRASAAPARRAA